jgi:hypothetical protein
MIDVLVPVLGRPQNVVPLVESIVATTSVDFSIIFICTTGDRAQIDACKETGARILTIKGGRSEYPRKMNTAFRKTDREFCLLGADDLEFEDEWDLKALACAQTTNAGVIGTNDCFNPYVMEGKFSTHPLVRRRYVETHGAALDGPGILCHEGYDHNYTDLELSELAQKRGEWAFCPESRVCHRHPGMLSKERDETYKKGFRQFKRDQQLFLKRQKLFA